MAIFNSYVSHYQRVLFSQTYVYESSAVYLDVSKVMGGYPQINHPFAIGIFHYKPSSYWGTPMTMETSIYLCIGVTEAFS